MQGATLTTKQAKAILSEVELRNGQAVIAGNDATIDYFYVSGRQVDTGLDVDLMSSAADDPHVATIAVSEEGEVF